MGRALLELRLVHVGNVGATGVAVTQTVKAAFGAFVSVVVAPVL